MATSAFKSTSKRATSSTTTTATKSVQSAKQSSTGNSTQKAPIRRSRSVSAFWRTQLDVSLDFQNKRDNPLFWVDGSPRSEDEGEVKLAKFDEVCLKSAYTSRVTSSNGVQSGRGRTVSRNSDGVRSFSVVGNGGRSNQGRSLSRVDKGRRRRSPSRGRSGNGNFERKREQGNGLLLDARSKSRSSSNTNRSVSGEKNNLVRSASDLSEVLESWNTWSSQHRVPDAADYSPRSLSGSRLSHWDDGGSAGSISEAEEKTIIPVSEVKKITTSSPEITTSRILSDFAPELAYTSAEELLRDFGGDFTRELEECEGRARKLRAELAVEECRELELSKLLNDIIPEPKTPQLQKPRAVRKASMERRKVSKRLEEEAMAYFDECVSISTFDDSDFSSLEDPPSHTTRLDVACPSQCQDLRQSQPMQCSEDYGLPSKSNTSSNDSSNTRSLNSSKMKTQSPITPNHSATISLEQDIKNYVRSFSKGNKRESISSEVGITARKSTECTSQAPVEQLLLDRVIFRSRIESGCMLLCGGSLGLPGAPFSSVL